MEHALRDGGHRFQICAVKCLSHISETLYVWDTICTFHEAVLAIWNGFPHEVTIWEELLLHEQLSMVEVLWDDVSQRLLHVPLTVAPRA